MSQRTPNSRENSIFPATTFTFDVDFDREGHVLFADRTQERAEMDDPIDAIVDDDFLQSFHV